MCADDNLQQRRHLIPQVWDTKQTYACSLEVVWLIFKSYRESPLPEWFLCIQFNFICMNQIITKSPEALQTKKVQVLQNCREKPTQSLDSKHSHMCLNYNHLLQMAVVIISLDDLI